MKVAAKETGFSNFTVCDSDEDGVFNCTTPNQGQAESLNKRLGVPED